LRVTARSIAQPVSPRLKKPKQRKNFMTAISQKPLNKLVASLDNLRRTAGVDTALHELASSIAAHGLPQSLVVPEYKKGLFAVVAGRRRRSRRGCYGVLTNQVSRSLLERHTVRAHRHKTSWILESA
jgi:hypothetical protein